MKLNNILSIQKNKKHKTFIRMICVWIALLFGYYYVRFISNPNLEPRENLIPEIINGTAKIDYIYSMYIMVKCYLILKSIGISSSLSFALIDFAGISFLVFSAYWFLKEYTDRFSSQILAILWLLGTTPLLFKRHFYHPSDFYGVGIMFFILLTGMKEKYIKVACLCFLSGFLWEKAIFVPVILFIYYVFKNGLKNASIISLPIVIGTLIPFLTWRYLFFKSSRILAFSSWDNFFSTIPSASIEWFIWTSPIIVIFYDIIANKRNIKMYWFVWMIYLPLILSVYFIYKGILIELRSFWILQPIFMGIIVNWADVTFSKIDKINET
ncbi:MAG: hypothetical protein JXR69_01760 [Candidatus Delongbacteria bacterium]|nr:hypothetical protein [Candidatus Delongbacteria bacterium]